MPNVGRLDGSATKTTPGLLPSDSPCKVNINNCLQIQFASTQFFATRVCEKFRVDEHLAFYFLKTTQGLIVPGNS